MTTPESNTDTAADPDSNSASQDWARQTEIHIGPVRFWPQDCLLRRADSEEQLTPKACALLSLLVKCHPHSAPRERILDEIWGNGRGSPESAAQVVAELRRKLGDDARKPRFIRTISKVGFQLLIEPLPGKPQTGPGNHPPPALQRSFGRRAGLTILLGALLVGFATLMVSLVNRHATAPTISAGTTDILPYSIIAGSAADESMPRFVPAIDRIVYGVKNPANGTQDIAWIAPDGSAAEIMAIPVTDEVSPAVSRDGRILAYVKRGAQRCDIVIADRAGQIERVVAQCPAVGPTSMLDLSGDGTRIAYTGTTNSNGARSIKVLNLESGSIINESDATQRGESDYGPRLSPDGEGFSFFRWNHDLETRELRFMLQGASTAIHCEDAGQITAHGWLPDGTLGITANNGLTTALLRVQPQDPTRCEHIAWLPGVRQFDVHENRLVLAMRDPHASFIVQVDATLQGDLGPGTVLSERATRQYLPRISPDDSLALFISAAGSLSDLWISDLAMTETRLSVKLPAEEITAAQWLPDNRHVMLGATSKPDQSTYFLVDTLAGEIREQWSCATDPDTRKARQRVALAALGVDSVGVGDCTMDAGRQLMLPDGILELRLDGSEIAYATLINSFGLFAIDSPTIPEQPLAEFAHGQDWSWDVSDNFIAIASQTFADGVSWIVRVIDRRNGSERELPAPGLIANAGLDITDGGQLLFVAARARNADIALVELPMAPQTQPAK